MGGGGGGSAINQAVILVCPVLKSERVDVVCIVS